jgi:hypothetical protein
MDLGGQAVSILQGGGRPPVVGRFGAEAAEAVPIRSRRRHLATPPAHDRAGSAEPTHYPQRPCEDTEGGVMRVAEGHRLLREMGSPYTKSSHKAAPKVGTVLIWVTPASSRHWSRQDGGATPKLGHHPNVLKARKKLKKMLISTERTQQVLWNQQKCKKTNSKRTPNEVEKPVANTQKSPNKAKERAKNVGVEQASLGAEKRQSVPSTPAPFRVSLGLGWVAVSQALKSPPMWPSYAHSPGASPTKR